MGASSALRGITRGLSLIALAVCVSLAVGACGCDEESASDGAASAGPSQKASAQQTTPAPAVANPLPVGQAVDSVAAPAITDVLGAPELTRAPEAEALIVSLVYLAPVAASEGDGERLLEAFLDHGAAPDPEHAGVDRHYDAEEFMVLFDTGDPAFQTIRVTVTPGSADVYVNADKAQ
jgi:hypothetical protein